MRDFDNKNPPATASPGDKWNQLELELTRALVRFVVNQDAIVTNVVHRIEFPTFRSSFPTFSLHCAGFHFVQSAIRKSLHSYRLLSNVCVGEITFKIDRANLEVLRNETLNSFEQTFSYRPPCRLREFTLPSGVRV